MNAPVRHEHSFDFSGVDDGIAPGETLLDIRHVSLSFGGVRAITDISFDVLKGEIRAIIGPNGAGKTSMLNVINGFYTPQEGTITFRGKKRTAMKPHVAVGQGIARTFQNVALFKGMSMLDNIMTGRLPCKSAICSGRRCGTVRPSRRGARTPPIRWKKSSTSSKSSPYPPHAGGQAALRLAKTG